MAHTTDPAAIVVDQEKLIQGVAKHFLHKVFGLEGMPWGTPFSNLEELAGARHTLQRKARPRIIDVGNVLSRQVTTGRSS